MTGWGYQPVMALPMRSVDGHGAGCQFFEIEILRLLDSHADGLDGTVLERARRLVFLAHRIAAVAPDAETVARQRELAELGLHVALGHDFFIDVERRLAQRLAVLARLVADELHAKRVLA